MTYATDEREWLETDGLGGFASGTVSGIRTRRYHATLLAATTPPTGRIVLVNGYEAWVEIDGSRVALSSQLYVPDVRHPDGAARIAEFRWVPWPTWVYRLGDGTEIEHEIFAVTGRPRVLLAWRLRKRRANVRLMVRPLLSGRDMHALHHENPAFRFDAQERDGALVWQPYGGLPAVVSRSNGTYAHEPAWFRQFLYTEERARGLDHVEDLASPGWIGWDLSREAALWVLDAATEGVAAATESASARAVFARARRAEQKRREAFPTPLHRAADAYLVRRGSGQTIIAGYPWFGDWGRDTFISVRGLCLATGRLREARDILLAWADTVSEGMLPNRFVEQGDAPEFNSVDASLWYVVAVEEYLRAMAARGGRVGKVERQRLGTAVREILVGYARGTRHGIRMDADGLLAAGELGVQLTWMDAKVGDWVVTPRIGKPVEIQALWIAALTVGAGLAPEWGEILAHARRSFGERFWDAERGRLYDVVDVNHQAGAVDASCRPNQIFAVGGLPISLLDGDRARRVVDVVEAELWTALGLRSLAPGERDYRPRYEGGVVERDGAYHQGTVWPWLIGPFVEAWVRVRGDTTAARRDADRRFLAPIRAHLDDAGLGHVSEIADAEPPHVPRGCPFQAWSVGEALRASQFLAGD